MDRTGTFPIRRLRRDESHNIRPRLSHTVDSGQPKSTRRVCRSTEAGRASQCIDYAMTIGRVSIIIYIIHLRPLVIQRPKRVYPNNCNLCRIPIDVRHLYSEHWAQILLFSIPSVNRLSESVSGSAGSKGFTQGLTIFGWFRECRFIDHGDRIRRAAGGTDRATETPIKIDFR